MTIVMTKRNEKKKNKKKGVEKKEEVEQRLKSRRAGLFGSFRRGGQRRAGIRSADPRRPRRRTILTPLSFAFLSFFAFFSSFSFNSGPIYRHYHCCWCCCCCCCCCLIGFVTRNRSTVEWRRSSTESMEFRRGTFLPFFFYFCCCRCVAGVPTDKWGFRVRFQFSFRRRDAHPSAPSRVFFLYFLSIFYYTFTHDTPPLWNGTRLLKVDSVFCFPLLRFFFGSGRDVCGLPHKRHRSAKKLKKIGSPCNESFTITQKEMSKEIESKVACWCCHSITNRWFVVFFSKCLDNGFTLVIFQLDILPWIPWGTGFKNSTRNIVFALKDC